MAILARDCPHCGIKKVALKVIHEHKIEGQNHVIFALCPSCKNPISARIRTDGMGINLVSSDENVETRNRVINVWPRVINPSAPKHTPKPVSNRFIEAEEAYKSQRWNSAVAMYRSALDVATKTLPDVPQGKNFFQRLIWLHEKQRITPDIKSWADHVRIEGNNALHDPEDFDESDTAPLRLFTEMFLRYVYELPGEVAAYRAETENASS